MTTPAAPKVSVVILVHNEERMLPGCLESCAFADEIVVVLDRCTDRSKEIASAAGATLVEGAYDFWGDRRYAGINAAANDWILEVDADERVTPELAAEVRRVLPDAEPGCFKIPFLNHIGQRPIEHGWGAYNGVGAKWALYKRGMKSWGNQAVDPKIELHGKLRALQGRMIHFVDEDLTDLFGRMNRYSRQAAQDRIAAGKVGGGFSAVRRFVTRFLKVYIGRKGWREGHYGLALALAAGLYPLWTYLKAREMLDQRRAETP